MIDVGPLERFVEGQVTRVDAGGHDIAIVRWKDDKVYAVRNYCPHQGGPLCEGYVGPTITTANRAVPGALVADDTQPVIVCPWHKWEFCLDDGGSLWDRSYRAKTYPTEVKDGRVLVGVRARRHRSVTTTG